MKKLFEGITRFIKGIIHFLRHGKAVSAAPVPTKTAPSPMSPGMIDYMRRHLGLKKSGSRFAGQPAWVKALMLDKAASKRRMRADKRRAT